MCYLCSWGLNEWGDIANIVIAVASVATAIVTARMLIKQHKLQQEQHKLEKEKLNAQQLEHQPAFIFDKSDKSSLIISAKGALAFSTNVSLKTIFIVSFEKPDTLSNNFTAYLWSMEIMRYAGRIRTINTDGTQIKFNKISAKTEAALKEKTNLIKAALQPYIKQHNLKIVNVIATNLIKIEYADIYKKERTLYYWEGNEITKDVYNGIIDTTSNTTPCAISKIDVEAVVKDVMLLKNPLI